MTDTLNTDTELPDKIYQIDEPQGDSGLLVNLLKYATLFVIIWCCAWVMIIFRLADQGSLFAWLGDHPGLTNLFLTIGICSYFFIGIRKKFVYGEPFELQFNDQQQTLTIKLKNTLENTIKTRVIPYSHLVVRIEIKNKKTDRYRKLAETQKIVKILYTTKLQATLNSSFTAWCRHPEIETILATLKSRSINNDLLLNENR
ncbi:MAG: hypothetical protein CFE21_09370 [Bacteroidetes bacterium B1(2017)]|nr:MAG: hypothetical protein CFE21_09370 [Bacteroidetes bacterium B1(2017)]